MGEDLVRQAAASFVTLAIGSADVAASWAVTVF